MGEPNTPVSRPSEARITLDRHGTIIAATPAAERLFGYDAGTLHGASVDVLAPARLSDAYGAAVHHICSQPACALNGLRLQARHRSGEEIPVDVSVALGDEGSRVIHISPVREITDRLRAEEMLLTATRNARETADRMRAVAAAASGMLGAASVDDLKIILRDACSRVIPFDAFTFGLFDAETREIRYLATYDSEIYSAPSSHPVAGTPSERVIAERRSLVTLSSAQAEAAGATLIGTMRRSESIIRTPLLAPDAVLGVISVQSYTPGVYTPEDVAVLECVAAVTATALQNVRLLEQRDRDRRTLELQQAYLEQLFAAAPEGIVLLDNTDCVLRINPEFTRMFGYAEHEAIGRPINQLLAPEHLRMASIELTERVTAGETVHVETVRCHKDGTLLDVSILGTPIRVSGSQVAVYGIYRDITARKQAEARLLEREQYFRSLIENTTDVIAVLDREARISYTSPGVENMLGYAPAALHGRPLATLMDRHSASAVQSAFQRSLIDPPTVLAAETRVRHADGSWRLLALTGRNLIDDPAVRGVVVNLRDVTEKRARDAQLQRTERLASLGTLIGGVAHELNNPLAAIKGYTELMLLAERSQDESETLETIAREAKRAAGIVADLRLLARESEEPPVMGPVDLNDAVRHVLKLRRHAHQTAAIRAGEDLDPALRHVWGDRGRLEQVILSLVINAEQALGEKHDDRQLTVHTRVVEGFAQLDVCDNGPGIRAADRERIFDPFWTTKATGVGTGLGLSIVQSVMTDHGGTVSVTSEPGEGACFRVELPVTPPDAPVRGAAAASASLARSPTPPGRTSRSPYRT